MRATLWAADDLSHVKAASTVEMLQGLMRLKPVDCWCCLKASHTAGVPVIGTKTPDLLHSPLSLCLSYCSFSFLLLFFLPSSHSLSHSTSCANLQLAPKSFSFFLPFLVFSSGSTRLLAPLRRGFRLSPPALCLVLRKKKGELSWTASDCWTK